MKPNLLDFDPRSKGANLFVDSECQMDHFVAAEEQIASERLRQKLEEVNVAARTNLAPIQDHIYFTLQRAYFKCAYKCFDRRRRQEEISKCVENCFNPLANEQQTFDNEMAKFHVSYSIIL
ncbi:hypothetical protein SESBI_14321 [Sesbania bispinosa]|nr:hypothetical protein SESBI_14321 [Sesbania bispinosa]